MTEEEHYSPRDLLMMALEQKLMKATEEFSEEQSSAIEALLEEGVDRETFEIELLSEVLGLIDPKY